MAAAEGMASRGKMEFGSQFQGDLLEQLLQEKNAIDKQHLRKLIFEEGREKMALSADGVTLDFSRQRMSSETHSLLLKMAEECGVVEKIKAMREGQRINTTEDRAVMHMALRADATENYRVDGKNIVPDVHDVLTRIKAFSGDVRGGTWQGASGKNLVNVLSVGIGGSYLGSEFVLEALRTDAGCMKAAKGRRLKFMANVDPIGFARATAELDPAETIVIIISKSFTTKETMLNATLCRNWIVNALGEDAVSKHVISCSANPKLAVEFGINENNVFGFWDWVGGRYSVTSAVGVMPLALHFGYDKVQEFLKGCRAMDQHWQSAPLAENLPINLALCGLWNATFLNLGVRGIIPYCEALSRFPAHVQQLDMESNGKGVSTDGKRLNYQAGEIILGEPGTNAQHSFFQLIHQGREIPLELIGFFKSQVSSENENLQKCISNNHQELMCNMYAQADALAMGKTREEVEAEGFKGPLAEHKTFLGNRPSLLILMDQLTPFTCGQLLALYEHRVATEGFIWGINSFDQWGVELGKILAKKLNNAVDNKNYEGLNVSTQKGLQRLVANL